MQFMIVLILAFATAESAMYAPYYPPGPAVPLPIYPQPGISSGGNNFGESSYGGTNAGWGSGYQDQGSGGYHDDAHHYNRVKQISEAENAGGYSRGGGGQGSSSGGSGGGYNSQGGSNIHGGSGYNYMPGYY